MNMRIFIGLAGVLGGTYPIAALEADEGVIGTYQLVMVERKAVETGSIEREPHPQGFITYGAEGRMMVLILRGARPKPSGRSNPAECLLLLAPHLTTKCYAVDVDEVFFGGSPCA